MAGRHPPHNGTTGESAELVYGEARDGRMAHISTVLSGAACDCVCPACRAPLVAKKGPEKAHHFSHASKTSCSSAPETALHRVAKEIISDQLRLFLPELKVSLEGKSKVIWQARQVHFERAVAEDKSLKTIVPDLVLWASERSVIVEIRVTHPCTPEKLAHLRKRGLAALEIDLSGVARDAERALIIEAVIESAPRRWVFNPKYERKLSEMRANLERENEEAARKLLAVEQALIDQYAEGVRTLANMPPFVLGSADAVWRLELGKHLGTSVPGYGCFSVVPALWQHRIMSEILRRHSAGSRDLRPNDALKMLRDDRMLREPFKFITKEMEASLCTREPGFLSPYRAIENWLDRLVTAGVLEKLRGGYGLTSGLARRFKELEESDRKKAERKKATLSQVTRILDRIPETERKQIKAEDWLRQPIQPFGISFAEAIDRDEKEYGDMARTLSQIERMIVSDGAICDADLGLPISGFRGREIESRRMRQEERQRAREETERIAGENRRTILKTELFKQLGKEALDWAEGQKDNFGGRDLWTIAQESEQGLRRVLDVLSCEKLRREQQQRIQEKIDSFRALLEVDAIKALGPERGKAFLGSPYPILKQQKPSLYCQDSDTLAECRALLEKVRRAKR